VRCSFETPISKMDRRAIEVRISSEWYERVLDFVFVKEFEVGIPPVLHPDSGSSAAEGEGVNRR
jgi:hypothetical protein